MCLRASLKREVGVLGDFLCSSRFSWESENETGSGRLVIGLIAIGELPICSNFGSAR